MQLKELSFGSLQAALCPGGSTRDIYLLELALQRQLEERVKAINVHTAHGANAAWEAIEYVATAKEALEVAAEAAATAGHDDAMVQALEQSKTLMSRWGMASA